VRAGLPSTAEPASEVFLRTAFNEQTGALLVDRVGRVWEAIATAHAGGRRGAGEVIAVIDIGFDVTRLPAERLHPASVAPPWIPHPDRGRHGTAVALLVAAAAPEAQLLVLDARDGDRFGVLKTAAAITTAAQHGARVVNISAEFETDCALRTPTGLGADVLFDIDPDPERFLAVVDRWIEFAEPYADARCRRKCRICDAVIAVSPTTVTIAASGNRYPTSCPACTVGSIGVGFQRSVLVESNGDVVRANLPPMTEHGDLTNPEVMIEEPPGFDGTSFASPLFAGLAALLPEPRDAAALAGLARAATPLLMLSLRYRDEFAAATPRTVDTLLRGFERFAARIPASHHHWLDPEARPCAICALVLTDWYDTLVSVHILRGSADDALRWGTTAARIAPFSATSASNAGIAWEMVADRTAGADRMAALQNAQRELERAVRLAPDIAAYRGLLERVLSAPR